MTRTTEMMDLDKAEARLPRRMLALAGVGTLGILLFARVRFGAGFAIGSGLGILNYIWLHNIVEALVNAGTVRPPKSALFQGHYSLSLDACRRLPFLQDRMASRRRSFGRTLCSSGWSSH